MACDVKRTHAIQMLHVDFSGRLDGGGVFGSSLQLAQAELHIVWIEKQLAWNLIHNFLFISDVGVFTFIRSCLRVPLDLKTVQIPIFLHTF